MELNRKLCATRRKLSQQAGWTFVVHVRFDNPCKNLLISIYIFYIIVEFNIFFLLFFVCFQKIYIFALNSRCG